MPTDQTSQNVHEFKPSVINPGIGSPAEPRDAGDGGPRWQMVSIILPTYNEEKYIRKCLECVLEQDYPQEFIEVLVVDGRSPDRTRVIVAELAARYPQIRLIDNPERLQAAGMNRAILASRGQVIVRMDAHTEYARDYVRRCVETLRVTGADNTGGPQRTKAKSYFQRAVAVALESRLGTGGAKCRHSGEDGYVDTVFCGAFRRQTLMRVGLFDPGAVTNEDAEINQRIIEAGGKIYLNSAIECYYYPRDSVKGLGVQYFRYGRGRARTLLKHGGALRVSPYIPFAFVFGTIALLLLGLAWAPFAWMGLASLLMYSMGIAGESARLARKRGWDLFPALPLVFATSHVAHGVGVAWGLLYYAFNPDWRTVVPPMLAQ